MEYTSGDRFWCIRTDTHSLVRTYWTYRIYIYQYIGLFCVYIFFFPIYNLRCSRHVHIRRYISTFFLFWVFNVLEEVKACASRQNASFPIEVCIDAGLGCWRMIFRVVFHNHSVVQLIFHNQSVVHLITRFLFCLPIYCIQTKTDAAERDWKHVDSNLVFVTGNWLLH